MNTPAISYCPAKWLDISNNSVPLDGQKTEGHKYTLECLMISWNAFVNSTYPPMLTWEVNE